MIGPSRVSKHPTILSLSRATLKYSSIDFFEDLNEVEKKQTTPCVVISGQSKSKNLLRQSCLQNSATLPISSFCIGKLDEVLANPGIICLRLVWRARFSSRRLLFSLVNSSFSLLEAISLFTTSLSLFFASLTYEESLTLNVVQSFSSQFYFLLTVVLLFY